MCFRRNKRQREMDIRQQLIQNIKAFMVAQSTLRSWQRPTSASPNNSVATDASYLLMQEKVTPHHPYILCFIKWLNDTNDGMATDTLHEPCSV